MAWPAPTNSMTQKKFVTFSYDIGWSQIIYQNCREWRDLKLCIDKNFHLRLFNGQKIIIISLIAITI